ncbi:MAG: cytochrome c family protein [Candidatus Brocadiaceae bacterium]|nr:cytochrome c family protein [Candidatus Brocadiaceae bacterium]
MAKYKELNRNKGTLPSAYPESWPGYFSFNVCVFRIKTHSCLLFFLAISMLVLFGGCNESEIHYSHKKHAARGLKDCNYCHPSGEDLEPRWPEMAKCLTCHMKNYDTFHPESCLLCHTKPGMKIKVKHPVPKKYKDINFSHKAHIENEVVCNQCHVGIEESDAITPDLIPDMFGNCIPCHKEMGKEKIACDVCHKHIKKNRRPLYHEERWVKHDDARWIQRHGNEFYYDQEYCQRCHGDLYWCVDCHQDQKPRNHNNAWRRKTHGFAASWERKKCSVCHQEDFCVRCHNNTKPLSHTASWGGINNRHCLNCHFPVSMVNCTVCHPNPAHPSAIDSPHPPFVGDCTQSGCHPVGRVGEGPHPTPFGVACTVCHLR